MSIGTTADPRPMANDPSSQQKKLVPESRTDAINLFQSHAHKTHEKLVPEAWLLMTQMTMTLLTAAIQGMWKNCPTSVPNYDTN